jgi:hypothetical protein
MLDSGYWILDARWWIPDIRGWISFHIQQFGFNNDLEGYIDKS